MPIDYVYDVFLSYRCARDVEIWVRKYFKPQLETELTHYLNGQDARIFLDETDIAAGTDWVRKIAEGLRDSKCLVPVWCPSYFRSEWCVSEWATFRDRNQAAGLKTEGLVIPASYKNPKVVKFAEAAGKTQTEDFSRFAYTGDAFAASTAFLDFETKVEEFAKTVAGRLAKTPPYSANHPIFVPDPTDLEGLPAQALRVHPELDLLMLGMPKIEQPRFDALAS